MWQDARGGAFNDDIYARRVLASGAPDPAWPAGGLLVCYLLTNVQHVAGKTLNASLIQTHIGTWKIGGFPLVMPNRVIGNVLIAAGALLIGFASPLTRLSYGEYLYVGELLSAILMFMGFRYAAKPQPDEALVRETIPAAPD